MLLRRLHTDAAVVRRSGRKENSEGTALNVVEGQCSVTVFYAMANVIAYICELSSTPGIPVKRIGLEAATYRRRKSKGL